MPPTGAIRPVGISTLSTGCSGLGVDPQFVTEYRAAALSAEVEERVVREVDDGGAVGPCAVTDPEGVVIGDGVGHLYGQFAGIPLFTVGRHVVHDDRIGGVRIDGPYAAVEPFTPPCNDCPLSFCGSRYCVPSSVKCTFGDAVC